MSFQGATGAVTFDKNGASPPGRLRTFGANGIDEKRYITLEEVKPSPS